MTIPFPQRFGFAPTHMISKEFPQTARVALAHLLTDLLNRQYIQSWSNLHAELCRTGRIIESEPANNSRFFVDQVIQILSLYEWFQAYILCERIYSHLLCATGYDPDPTNPFSQWIEDVSLTEVRTYYSRELNTLLAEENLDYQFVDGQFQRRGRLQTQKNLQRIGAVLGDPRLTSVRLHFYKAKKFFDQRPTPDIENCTKEAVCALEAALETLSGKSSVGKFNRLLNDLTGNDVEQIPPPIAGAMDKIYAYRGSGKGIAHAALAGNSVSELEELVLSVTAAFITYLYDLFPEKEEDIPF